MKRGVFMIFLDILNQKVYNINRVGENVVSVEEYDGGERGFCEFHCNRSEVGWYNALQLRL